jgi:RHS repeat-associated protein
VGGRTTGQKYVYGVGDDGARQKFTGKERDTETGLDYFLARYYSSIQGRFNSPDLIIVSEKQIMNPQSWNLYNYVSNNPLAYIDPTGMELVKLGQHTDQDIDAKRKQIAEQIKQEKKAGTLTSQRQKELEGQRKTLGLEKEGNKLGNQMLKTLNSKQELGNIQLSDLTLSTDPASDFKSDATLVNLLGGAQNAQVPFNEAANSSMFSWVGYSDQIYINTTFGDYQAATTENPSQKDAMIFMATQVKHEKWHLVNQSANEKSAYTEQLRVLQKFGPKAFSSESVYNGLRNNIAAQTK